MYGKKLVGKIGKNKDDQVGLIIEYDISTGAWLGIDLNGGRWRGFNPDILFDSINSYLDCLIDERLWQLEDKIKDYIHEEINERI